MEKMRFISALLALLLKLGCEDYRQKEEIGKRHYL